MNKVIALKASGLIANSDSLWGSPVSVFKLKDDSQHMVIHYRLLMRWPLLQNIDYPLTEQMLGTIEVNSIF